MKFKLRDRDGKEIHEGIMATLKRPEIVTWGPRAFLYEISTGPNHDLPVYRETTVFKIGGR